MKLKDSAVRHAVLFLSGGMMERRSYLPEEMMTVLAGEAVRVFLPGSPPSGAAAHAVCLIALLHLLHRYRAPLSVRLAVLYGTGLLSGIPHRNALIFAAVVLAAGKLLRGEREPGKLLCIGDAAENGESGKEEYVLAGRARKEDVTEEMLAGYDAVLSNDVSGLVSLLKKCGTDFPVFVSGVPKDSLLNCFEKRRVFGMKTAVLRKRGSAGGGLTGRIAERMEDDGIRELYEQCGTLISGLRILARCGIRKRKRGEGLRVLAVSQHYWPEPYPFDEICEALVSRGHRVHVITDVPNYPHGHVYDGYEHGKQRRQYHNGVTITRTYTCPRRNSLFFRFLNYYSFALSSVWYALGLKGDYDIVFVNQSSPVMMAYAGIVYAKLHGKKSILYCMDLWPASLKAGGIVPGSLLYRYYHMVSAAVYRSCSLIFLSSESFRDYMRKEFGIPEEHLLYVPQFSSVMPHVFPRVFSEFNFVYAGNIGNAQMPEMLVQAAERIRAEKNGKKVMWHVIGGGSRAEWLKEETKKRGLGNVVFHGRVSRDALSFFLGMADVCVLTMMPDADIAGTVPARLQTYLCAGRPVLAAAGGRTAALIGEYDCGICVSGGDAAGFMKAAEDIMERDLLHDGRMSRKAYEDLFGKERFLNAFDAEAGNLLSGKKEAGALWQSS